MSVERIPIARQKILRGDLFECCAELGLEGRVLVLSSARGAALADWAALLPEAKVTVHDGAGAHNPQAVVDAATELAQRERPDHLFAVGGGSVIDLAKALVGRVPADVVAVPTTLGGAEMSRVFGVRRDDGIKDGGGGGKCLPGTVCYVPDLLDGLSTSQLAASGMNALAHAVEARYARRRHWMGRAAAETAGRALPDLLRAATGTRGPDLHAELFEAASLAGFALNYCGMGLHHGICHVLGGLTGIGHGELNAVVLPAAVAANQRHAPDAVAEAAAGFGVGDLSEELAALVAELAVPRTLAELGIAKATLDKAVPLIAGSHHMRNNPATLDEAAIESLLRDADDVAGHA